MKEEWVAPHRPARNATVPGYIEVFEELEG
jgi:hypothetical protein